MRMFITLNALFAQVKTDLRAISPDPGLTFNAATGEVKFAPSMSSPHNQLFATLAASPVGVGIQGQIGSYPIPEPGNLTQTLSEIGGATLFDTYPGPTFIDIYYDCESGAGCSGRGYMVEGTSGYVDMPTDAILFHELTHARHLATMGFSGGLATAEADAIRDENLYRQAKKMAARAGLAGGCKPSPPEKPKPEQKSGKGQTGPKPTGGCFVATAALEHTDQEKLDFLRSFRDGPMAATERTREFFDRFYAYYYQFSPSFADVVRRDANLRELVACAIALPLANYLKMAIRFPSSGIPEAIPDDWAFFLGELRDDLEDWATRAVPPLDRWPSGFTEDEMVRDGAFMLGHILRSPERRRAYLAMLRPLLEPRAYERVLDSVESQESPWH